jgi:hypothetical protein
VSTPARLAAFTVALLVALGIGAGVGAAIGPAPADDAPAATAEDCEPTPATHEGDHGGFG